MEEGRVTTTSNGPHVERSDKQTHAYSGRIVLFVLLCVAILIGAITLQARFKIGGNSPDVTDKNYRAPQPSGFAEMAAEMRRDRLDKRQVQAARPSPDARGPRTQKIVIEEARETRAPQYTQPALPRYYSNRDDAQAASTLRTLKMQALAAKPIAEDFKKEVTAGGSGSAEAASQGGQARQVMDSASMAALMRQQDDGQPDLNRQAEKMDFFRGANGGASMTPQGYSASLPLPQQFPYELKAGTLIPGILISGINSDLPGNVLAQVSENVWDTAIGKYVLIP
jgi:type IV secretory pathway VirB10-like protein